MTVALQLEKPKYAEDASETLELYAKKAEMINRSEKIAYVVMRLIAKAGK